MKVILLQDVQGIGKKDQMVDAKEGYARNFLFPKKLAIEANKANVNQLEAKKKSERERRAAEIAEATDLKTKLEANPITMAVKTGEGGRLFGSITNKEVAAHLLEHEGMDIDRKKITVPQIKTVGEHQAEIKLHTEVMAMLTLHVTSL